MFNTPVSPVGRECKPDPEDMLQNARRKREKVEQDIKAYEGFDNYHRASPSAHCEVYGAMHAELVVAKKSEQHWLDEIDKD